MAVEECPVYIFSGLEISVCLAVQHRDLGPAYDQDTQLLLCVIFHFVMLVYEQILMKIHSEGHLNIRNAQMKTQRKVLTPVQRLYTNVSKILYNSAG